MSLDDRRATHAARRALARSSVSELQILVPPWGPHAVPRPALPTLLILSHAPLPLAPSQREVSHRHAPRRCRWRCAQCEASGPCSGCHQTQACQLRRHTSNGASPPDSPRTACMPRTVRPHAMRNRVCGLSSVRTLERAGSQRAGSAQAAVHSRLASTAGWRAHAGWVDASVRTDATTGVGMTMYESKERA